MIDKELVIDNIQGAMECIKTLEESLKYEWKDSKQSISILESLVNGNLILLRQTKSYLREELK